MPTIEDMPLVKRFYGSLGYGTPTERQLEFLFSLVSERDVPTLGTCGEERFENMAAQLENRRPNRQEVSRWIDALGKRPRAASEGVTEEPHELVGPGVYEVPDHGIYVVRPNRDGTRVYALRLVELPPRVTEEGTRVDFELVFERGAMRFIREEHLMPLTRATELLTRYGRCLRCRRRLKAAKSVERAIGPVCIKYFKR